jgi:hypothetical protein
MTIRFEYGTARIKDFEVHSGTPTVKGKRPVLEVRLNGEPMTTSNRFWNSLHLRFGFTSNIFRYFSHQEVFDRISTVASNDRVGWCRERDDEGNGHLLAVTGTNAATIPYDDLSDLLKQYETHEIKYSNGVVRSTHSPRRGGTFQLGGDGFQNRFIIETPIDGFGRPSVYLSLLRLICSNGAVGYSPAFRSELSVGKGDEGIGFALTRVLDGFNNEDGYVALRQRFESGTRSWASVHEVNGLYKCLARLHNREEIKTRKMAFGTDGASEFDVSPLFHSFHKLTGDLTQVYGLSNMDALSVKRQRTLPAACKVYALLNFASEVATHHATEQGYRTMQAYIGDLISNEFDLEGTTDQFSDWRDFFVANDQTTSTLAHMQQRM